MGSAALKPSLLYIDPNETGAEKAFNTPLSRICFPIEKPFSQEMLNWITVILEMNPHSTLAAELFAEHPPQELKACLIHLSIHGIEEIHILAKTKEIAKKYITLCKQISKQERLGLKIWVSVKVCDYNFYSC